MKNYYPASLCKNGILGGGITVEDNSFTYHTGKITVPQKYRNLRIPFCDILALSTGRTLLFPWVSVSLSSGEDYKFIIFGRKSFLSSLRARGINC